MLNERTGKALEALEAIDGLELELIGSWLWVSGNTKEHKDKIKEVGGMWCKTKSKWYVMPTEERKTRKRVVDHEQIRLHYGSRILKENDLQ